MPSLLETSPVAARGYRLRPGLWIALALAVVTAAILIAERRAGQDWGGDFALYISHARNLAEGRPYADTGYIVNPYFRSVSPSSYPPLFPAVLAPLYARYGIDYEVLKLPGIICFALSIPVLFCLFCRDLPAPQSLLAVFLWAAWPWVLTFKDAVLPDFLFLLLWLLALWLLRIAYDEPLMRRPVLRGVIIGVLAYAAYATRTAGIVLPAAILLYDFLRFRRITRFAVCVAGVFAALTVTQGLLIHTESSYLQMFAFRPRQTVHDYVYSLSILFTSAAGGWQRLLRYAAIAPAVALVCVGYVVSFRRFRSPLELTVALYGVLLLLWSLGTGTRYMMPLVPFFFLYLFIGLGAVTNRLPSLARNGVLCGLLLLILSCYAIEDIGYTPGPNTGGISTPGFAELCQFIRTNTSSKDIFIFGNPRVLSLYTRRAVSVYPEHGDPQMVWNYSHDIHARYMIVTDFLYGDSDVWRPFMREYGDRLRPVFSNANFQLYAFGK